MQMNRTTVFLLGVCAGVAAPLIAKVVRPLSVYAVGGGMIAYEAACDAAEASRDTISASAKKIRRRLKKAIRPR
jgi:hypothetical protein